MASLSLNTNDLSRWVGLGLINFVADPFKVALTTSAASGSTFGGTGEISGDGYTSGGASLSGTSLSSSGVWLASDVTWAALTTTFSHAVLYRSGTIVVSGSLVTNPRIGTISFGGDIVMEGGPFVLQWSSSGIIDIG